jgi:hypothetical protein
MGDEDEDDEEDWWWWWRVSDLNASSTVVGVGHAYTLVSSSFLVFFPSSCFYHTLIMPFFRFVTDGPPPPPLTQGVK